MSLHGKIWLGPKFPEAITMMKLRPVRSALLVALSLSLTPLVNAQTAGSAKPLSKEELLRPLDPDLRDVVLLYDAIKGTPDPSLTPQDARQQIPVQLADKVLARGVGTAEQPRAVGKVIDGMTFTNRVGEQIPIRIYVPQGTGPVPTVVYFHGGGLVVARIDTYDVSARALCVGAGAIVVSVEYRMAPEAPFPAALNDAVDAYKWVLSNIGSYNGLPDKVAVAGESAGGNLAIEVSIAARDGGLPMPTHELLVYPEATNDLNQTSDLLYTSSVLPLNTALLTYLGAQYLPNAADKDTPGAAPFYANLKKLPPTTIIAAEEDPLRTDGEDLFAKLQGAGNRVQYKLYTGTTHEFFGMGDFVKKAANAEAFVAAALKGSF